MTSQNDLDFFLGFLSHQSSHSCPRGYQDICGWQISRAHSQYFFGADLLVTVERGSSSKQLLTLMTQWNSGLAQYCPPSRISSKPNKGDSTGCYLNINVVPKVKPGCEIRCDNCGIMPLACAAQAVNLYWLDLVCPSVKKWQVHVPSIGCQLISPLVLQEELFICNGSF